MGSQNRRLTRGIVDFRTSAQLANLSLQAGVVGSSPIISTESSLVSFVNGPGWRSGQRSRHRLRPARRRAEQGGPSTPQPQSKG